MTIGTRGVAADTGYDGRTLESIRGGPPFNRPTNLAVAPSGELYVTDGYGNCKVHRFSATGDLIQSWGEPGTGPGQFHLPHGLRVAADGRVLVADRENDRIQIFSADGRFLEQWTDVQRPTNIAIDRAGNIYVSELWWRIGQRSQVHGVIVEDKPGRVSVFDAEGRLLTRWGGPDRCAPGNFVAPHDICVDAHGDLYVAEVTGTFAGQAGLVPPDCHTFQKFRRTDAEGR
jgi:DNA-binding beta-propeller fold protein YncE